MEQMNYSFSVCSSELDYDAYLAFLLENYEHIRLPYPFPVTLSFLASPLLMGEAAFLIFNEENQVIGAFSYIRGTGEHRYEDRHIVQIQVACIAEEHRCTRLFLYALQYFTQYLAHGEEQVQEFRFFAPSDDSLRRLFSKISSLTASLETDSGPLDEYRASFSEWQSYASQFRQTALFNS